MFESAEARGVRVVGVDPGLSRCGVGVVDGPSARPTVVTVGVVRTPADAPVAARLERLYDELSALLAATSPDAVAVERVFLNANVRTGMGVGQAAGVALLCAQQAGVDVVEYTPSQVKASVAGSGAADKAQIGVMVQALLRLGAVPRPADCADALALALCHLQHGSVLSGGGAMAPRLAAAWRAAAPGAQKGRLP